MKNKNSIISNLMWRFAESFGGQGIVLILSIILARLLDPAVYGTVALVTALTGIVGVFIDSGMGTALIQKKEADDTDFSSVFYFNIVICFVLYIAMFFLAPVIAEFYNQPILVPVVRVLSITLIISGVNNVQISYVSKKLLFKKYFWATFAGTMVSAVVGITMAYMGYGVWALVLQQLLNAVFKTIIIWIVIPWRPKLLFSVYRLQELFAFGWKMLASGLIDRTYNELRTLIIGKMYTTESLAFYNKGRQLPNQVVASINASIDSILLPTMSQEQDNRIILKTMTRRAIKTSTYIIAPLLIGLAACAEVVVEILLTEKWLPCVLFMRIFCITLIFYPIHTSNLNAIKAMGRSDLFLKLEIVKKFVGIASILVTMWISVEAMAYSLFVTTLLSTIINAFPNKKLLNYSWFEQMKDIMPGILTACLMGAPVFLLGFLPLADVLVLVIQVFTGGIVYLLLSILFRLESFRYVWETAKGFLAKKKTNN